MSVLRSGEAYLNSLKELHFKVVWSLEVATGSQMKLGAVL